MSSKSVLILGIVFIFLLNVIAVHNYIDSYYYQPQEIDMGKDESLLNKIFKDNNESKKIIEKELKTQKDEKIDENLTILEESNINEEKNSSENMLDKISEKLTKKLKQEDEKNKKEEKIVKSEVEKLTPKANKNKKEDIKTKDESDKSALMILTLNANDEYEQGNPIIKKMSKKFDNRKVVKIKIYGYSTKIKDIIENIKSEFIDYGLDIDDIRVLYKKDENKKNKIKILLSKKD